MRILSWLFGAVIGTVMAMGQTDPAVTSPRSDTPPVPFTSSSDTIPHFQPITPEERVKWVLQSTVGPASLGGGVISAGWGTLFNKPREYGTHWPGFGERYGMRLTGLAVSNSMEAGLGALWGEDPRYFPMVEQPFKKRLGHVVKMTFLAENREGHSRPAYARYIAIPGSNFLSNTWRADSAATLGNAAVRTALGFLGRICGNAFREFWPSVARRFSRKDSNGNLTGGVGNQFD